MPLHGQQARHKGKRTRGDGTRVAHVHLGAPPSRGMLPRTWWRTFAVLNAFACGSCGMCSIILTYLTRLLVFIRMFPVCVLHDTICLVSHVAVALLPFSRPFIWCSLLAYLPRGLSIPSPIPMPLPVPEAQPEIHHICMETVGFLVCAMAVVLVAISAFLHN